MRRALNVAVLVIILTFIAAPAGHAQRGCDWSPSSDCPVVPRTAASYPCYDTQIKGDWTTMLYHTTAHASYAMVGASYSSDVWCFDSTAQALDYGFRRAYR
jgi:hypothetical protein